MNELLGPSLHPPPVSPSVPSPRLALAHVVLALGAHIMRADGRRDLPCDRPQDAGTSTHDPLAQFRAALRLQPQILENTFVLSSFQAS